MLIAIEPRLGVCPVCEEVFTLDGDDTPVCENCLTQLDRWTPEPTPPERAGAA